MVSISPTLTHPQRQGSSGSRSRGYRLKPRTAAGATLALAAFLGLALAGQAPSYAADAPVGLGTAGTYSVLGGAAVTNTGPTTLAGDLGVNPGTAITGFPPGLAAGATHAGDAQAGQAQSDLTTAYNDAAGRAVTASVSGDLVGQTLSPGVYNSSGPLAVSGALTLNGQGNPNSVFIFQVASTLTTASASNIVLTNSAQACNVYWQVGSSATLGTASTFNGNILALTSITVTAGTTVQGRALARNGQVTLDTNVFTMPGCATASPSPSPTASPSPSPSATATPTATVSPSPTTAPASPGATTPATGGTGTGPSPAGTVPGAGGTGGSGGGSGVAGVSNDAAAGTGVGTAAETGRGVNIDTAAASQTPYTGLAGGAAAALLGLAVVLMLTLRRRPDRRN